MSMMASQILQGYLTYWDNKLPKSCTNTSEGLLKGMRKGNLFSHINGSISVLIDGKYWDFPVHAYNEMAEYIKDNFPMEYNQRNLPTKRYQVIVQCHYKSGFSYKNKTRVLYGVIDFCHPVTNSLVDIANLTGVDKTTEEDIDYSNTKEIDLGPSDNDWDV